MHRRHVRLDPVSSNTREAIVIAWVFARPSSPYAKLEDMSFSPHAGYPLMTHVTEVTRAGIDLARRAAADWGTNVDDNVLVATHADNAPFHVETCAFHVCITRIIIPPITSSCRWESSHSCRTSQTEPAWHHSPDNSRRRRSSSSE